MNILSQGSTIFVVAGTASFMACIIILLTQRLHGKLSLDTDLCSIQKCHIKPVPRIGGLAAFAGLLAVSMYQILHHDDPNLPEATQALLLGVLAATPAFVAGLLEDLTKAISVRARLIATFISALAGSWLLGASLTRVDLIGFDYLLQFAPIALLTTSVAVAGVSNSINIIDGFHGIAAGSVAVILTGFAVLGYQLGDEVVVALTLAGIGTTVGLILLNYPTGRIFMGDGGAYLLGFWVAESAVLLVARHPEINAWRLLAICAYPVTEVIFSIYRRKVIRKISPGAPDRLHLHTLIYRRLIFKLVRPSRLRPWNRNASVACVVVPWITLATWAAVQYGSTILGSVLITLVQVLIYVALYGRLVRGHWCFRPAVLLGLRRQTKPNLI
jgi:UDP-N-acetylmuramyl pentapeptide phosphotransferase/UDP-N-acetylglucosamine-1-phosphate transferase